MEQPSDDISDQNLLRLFYVSMSIANVSLEIAMQNLQIQSKQTLLTKLRLKKQQLMDKIQQIQLHNVNQIKIEHADEQQPSTSCFVRGSHDRATPLVRKKKIQQVTNEMQVTDINQQQKPTLLRHKTAKPRSDPTECPIAYEHQETLSSDVQLRKFGQKHFGHLLDFEPKPDYQQPTTPPKCNSTQCKVCPMIARNTDSFHTLA